MLLNAATLEGIREGTVDRAFRAWKRPTVKTGGTLNTRVGQLAIDDVAIVAADDITDDDAHAAGFASAAAVIASLRPGDDRSVYRIRFHLAGDDPRVALRADDDLSDDDRAALDSRLDRWDRSAGEPWTRRYLRLISDHPAVVSTELAPMVGMERFAFKDRVRRLKGLGLTESLDVGYRLSPRGSAYLRDCE